MEMNGLPAARLHCDAAPRTDEFIRSQWEQQSIADAEQRPPANTTSSLRRKATLEASRKRYPLLTKLISIPEEERV